LHNESIVGHRQLWELFESLKSELQITPLVLNSDDFLANPIATLSRLGKAWQIEFNEGHLE
jgi:hypothetical protein